VKEHRGRDAVRPQPLHGAQAVEARHHDVHDDDVEALLGQQLQGGLAVIGAVHPVPGQLQIIHDGLRHLGTVFHHQYFHALISWFGPIFHGHFTPDGTSCVPV
jgi:hypothetical protein